MNTKRNIINVLILIFICYLALDHSSWATSEGGGEAWSFLKIGTGARAIGMGGAFVSVADDATATYWNPAGLVLLSGYEITAMVISPSMRYDLSSGITNKHNYFSFCAPSPYGNFGISLNWFKSGIIKPTKGTSIYDFQFINDDRKGNSSEWALNASYGLAMPDPNKGSNSMILIGFNLRHMKQQLFELSTGGFGFDTGIIIKTKYNEPIWIFGNPRLGYIAKYNSARKWKGTTDIGDSEYKVDDKYRDPSNLGWELGASADIVPNLTTAISLINTSNGSPLKMSLGSEFRLFNDQLAFRTGFGSWNIQKRNSSDETWKQKKFKGIFSFGIGLNFPSNIALTKIDYVYTLDSIYANHQMSISFKF